MTIILDFRFGIVDRRGQRIRAWSSSFSRNDSVGAPVSDPACLKQRQKTDGKTSPSFRAGCLPFSEANTRRFASLSCPAHRAGSETGAPIQLHSYGFSLSLFPVWNSWSSASKDMLKHGLHARKALRCAAVKVVKVVMVKKLRCKCLMVNGVKPGQGKSNQLGRGVKVVGQAAKFAGLGSGNSWHPMWQYLNLGARYCQLLSDKFTYCHVWSPIGEKTFLQRAFPLLETAGAHLDTVPGREGALRRPRRRAERQATETTRYQWAPRAIRSALADSGGDIAARCPYQNQEQCQDAPRRQIFARNMPGMCFVRRVANSLVCEAGITGAGGEVFVNQCRWLKRS